MDSIDKILNKMRPCKNFMNQIIFLIEVNIYIVINFRPYNHAAITNDVVKYLLSIQSCHKLFQPQNLKQHTEPIV